MPEHRRRRAAPSGGGKPLAPFGLRAARTRLLCYGSSMVLGHHLCRRASHPDPRRLQHGLSDFCHGLLGIFAKPDRSGGKRCGASADRGGSMRHPDEYGFLRETLKLMRRIGIWLVMGLCFGCLLLQAQNLPESNPYTGPTDVEEGRQFFMGHCAECHGRDGEGGRGINLTTGRYRLSRSDADLLRNIQKGIPGSEMPRSRLPVRDLWKVVAFVRSLGRGGASEQASGDAAAGRTVYGRMACAGCHAIHRQGRGLGPDLSDVGLRRSLTFLRDALINPSLYIPTAYPSVTVVTRGGRQVRGIRLNEDDFSIQVGDMLENLHSLPKGEVAEIRHDGESLMPAYGSLLSAKEVEDLVAYMNSLRESR